MVINSKKIKEVLAKGILLLGITGTLTLSDGVATIGNPQVVYAATTVQSKKESALKSLEKAYKTYYKKYYTEKEYNKLTKIYNKGIKALNSCKTKTEISDTLELYKEKLLEVKPSIFVKYQQKMEKNLLTYYNNLLKNNSYSTDGLVKLEETKNAAVENIYNKKTKTKAKKAKANGIKELNSVITLSMEKRDYAIMIINYSDLSKEEKETKINEINNLYENNSIDDALEIITPYEKKSNEKIEEENAVITVDQIENKIKELCKKYPKYTKEEIRVLVATANMDFVKDEDLLIIFEINSKEKLIECDEILNSLLSDMWNSMKKKGLTISHGSKYEDMNSFYPSKIHYDDMVWISELCLNKKMKEHFEYFENEYRNMIFKNPKKGHNDDITEGVLSSVRIAAYFFKVDCDMYDDEITIPMDDTRLSGGAGYMFFAIMCHMQARFGSYRTSNVAPKGEYADSSVARYINQNYNPEHFLENRLNKKVKEKQ